MSKENTHERDIYAIHGTFIVTDPEICHGKPTFRGTRVLVSDVLEQVASGMAWETIIEEWNDSISKEAIQEAIQLAVRLLSSTQMNLRLSSRRMNILDENISKSQRQLLESWRVSIKQVGVNAGHSGMKDSEIIPFLQGLRRPTFFTRDDDFFKPTLCHARYSHLSGCGEIGSRNFHPPPARTS
ncbi:MAG: DUF433 domain-containing protein [Anaerolineales bacterium]